MRVTPPSPVTDVQIVGACYYLPPAEFEARLQAVAALLATPAVRLQAVALASPTTAARRGSRLPWIESTGEFLDMSAYRAGLEASPPSATCLVLNDTLFIRHPWRRVVHGIAALLPALASFPTAAAAGEVHPSTDLLLADAANPGRRHLSTFCFAVNADARGLLGDVLASLPLDGGPDAAQSWLDEQTSRSVALRTLLHVHLQAPANPWSWKRQPQMPAADLRLRKSITVAVEYLFTTRLLQQGGCVMPINQGLGYRIMSRLAARAGR